jgi:hypothetical protein
MGAAARRRRGLEVFRWDVRMGLSALWTPKGGILDGVQIQRSVRIQVEGCERSTGGVEAVLWHEGAILGLEGARHPESGGLVDDVIPVVSDTIIEVMKVLESATPKLPVLHLVDVKGGEDDVEVVCTAEPGDVRGEEVDVEAAVLDSSAVGADDLGESCGGIGDGARVFVGVDIDEEGEDVAAELDEGEGDVGALRGIETVEIVPLVWWNEPTTAVHGSEVAGLALPGGEGREEGIEEAIFCRRPSRRFGGLVGLGRCVTWRTRVAGGDVYGHADRCEQGRSGVLL